MKRKHNPDMLYSLTALAVARIFEVKLKELGIAIDTPIEQILLENSKHLTNKAHERSYPTLRFFATEHGVMYRKVDLDPWILQVIDHAKNGGG